MWRKKFNKELLEKIGKSPIKCYIICQRIQWFGNISRGNNDNIVKAVISWKPTRKKPQERPGKRWMDVVKEDLKRIGVNNWLRI